MPALPAVRDARHAGRRRRRHPGRSAGQQLAVFQLFLHAIGTEPLPEKRDDAAILAEAQVRGTPVLSYCCFFFYGAGGVACWAGTTPPSWLKRRSVWLDHLPAVM